jgi:hypothetical protein
MFEYAIFDGWLAGIPLGHIDAGACVEKEVGICFVAQGKFEFRADVQPVAGGEAAEYDGVQGNAEISIIVQDSWFLCMATIFSLHDFSLFAVRDGCFHNSIVALHWKNLNIYLLPLDMTNLWKWREDVADPHRRLSQLTEGASGRTRTQALSLTHQEDGDFLLP